jgi:hypothetical protein
MNIETNFFRGVYPTELATLYTVLPGQRIVLTTVNIINRVQSIGSAYLYLVPFGGTHDTSNVLFSKKPIDFISIPATGGYGYEVLWKGWEVLNSEGATIQGYCTGNLTIHINGLSRPLTNV